MREGISRAGLSASRLRPCLPLIFSIEVNQETVWPGCPACSLDLLLVGAIDPVIFIIVLLDYYYYSLFHHSLYVIARVLAVHGTGTCHKD